MEERIENNELDMAEAFVRDTGCHVFLTGKAGTGKTTFLKRLQSCTGKRMIITAPTGVAAINAGGVTLHSFFQLPFGPFVPGGENYRRMARRMFRFSKEKKKIIKSLDLLVIDEISMVRADLLDAVDEVLRRHRRSEEPFGGVQLLMIGDLHQLSPVAKADEWQLLSPHYESVYFFSSLALSRTQWLPIELKHIYRQTDPGFIRVLNQVRSNGLDPEGLEVLNQRHIPGFKSEPGQGYITLTTHNRSADAVNRERLDALAVAPHYFEADITGEFPDQVQPAPTRLCLKKGAQVMFLRNDPSPDKRYYNGRIGVISAISGDQIWVDCPGDETPISVKAMEWEHIQYQVDPETQEIQSHTLGKFKQYPLKPAWAVTVHKSQGLTFDRAVIDVESAFTHGQVYVALSRCKTLEGMVLSSPIPERGIGIDPAVAHFDQVARDMAPTREQWRAAAVDFQQKLMLECFDFGLLGGRLSYLFRIIRSQKENIQVSGLTDMDTMEDGVRSQVVTVGDKFRAQLGRMFDPSVLPVEDPRIRERIQKASAYFSQTVDRVLSDVKAGLHLETDNKELKKRLTNAQTNLMETLAEKQAGVGACSHGFSVDAYLRAVAHARAASLPSPAKTAKAPAYSEADIAHPELFQILKEWRARTAKEEGLAHFQVMHQKTLVQIVVHLPQDEQALLKLKGVGPKIMEKYGDAILEQVNAFRREKDIQTVVLPPPSQEDLAAPKDKKKAPKKGDSRKLTLTLLQEGKTIPEIATERELAVSTIQGHLVTYVEKGELGLDGLVTPEKQAAITALAEKKEHKGLSELKQALGPDYDYGEIRLVLALQKHHTA